MSTELSRAKLYELVWSRPRTERANELGVSDVAMRKHCIKSGVPVPPAGYWASLQHGKKVQHPSLPIRLPGCPDVVEIGGRRDQWYQAREEDLNAVLDSPVFLEDIDKQVSEALRRIGKVTAYRDLSSLRTKRFAVSFRLRRSADRSTSRKGIGPLTSQPNVTDAG